MRLQIAVPESQVTHQVLDAALEATTRINEGLIRRGMVPPFLEAVKNGVRWKPEPPGAERFDHAALVNKRGWGDCDDLAPYRAAELRVTGADKDARAVVMKKGPYRWHAIVVRGSGAKEDPSLTAGMGSRVSGTGQQIDEGQATSVGWSAAPVVSPMFRTPGKCGFAYYPIRRGRQVVGWHARADLPWSGTRYSLVGTTRCRRLADAMADACMGVACVGQAMGAAEPSPLAKMLAMEALLRGVAPQAVMSELRARGLVDGHSTVGDFLGDLADVAAPIAGGMLGGPIGAMGAGFIEQQLKQAISQGGGGAGRPAGGAVSMPGGFMGNIPMPSGAPGNNKARARGGSVSTTPPIMPIIVRF